MADEAKTIIEIEATDNGTIPAVEQRLNALHAEVLGLTNAKIRDEQVNLSLAQSLNAVIIKTREAAEASVIAAEATENQAQLVDVAVQKSLQLSIAEQALAENVIRATAATEAQTQAQIQMQVKAGMIAFTLQQATTAQQASTNATYQEMVAKNNMIEVLVGLATVQQQLNLVRATEVTVEAEQIAALNAEAAARGEQMRVLLAEAAARNESIAAHQRQQGLAAASTTHWRQEIDVITQNSLAQARNAEQISQVNAARIRALAALNSLDAANARLIEVELSTTATQAQVVKATNDVAVAEERATLATNALASSMTRAGTAAVGFEERLLMLHGATVLNQRQLGGLGIGLGSLAGASMPVIIGMTALAAALASASSNSMEWEHELVMLINNTTAADDVIQRLSHTMLEFGSRVGGSLDQMAQGARIILDFGYTTSEAINMLVETSKLAVATGADQADTAQAIGQAMHQYGAAASETADYIETLYAASLRSNSTLATFSDESKRATGIAAELGISYREVTSAISALTRVYGTVAEAQTQVLGIMRYLAAPTKEEAEAWDALARSSGNYNLASENLLVTLSESGLTGLLDQVNAAYDKLGLTQEEQIARTYELVNAQRGGQGMLLLLSQASDDYHETLTATADVEAALNRELQTSQSHWNRLGNSWQKATAEGTGFNEVSKQVADGLRILIALFQTGVIAIEMLGRAAYGTGQLLSDLATQNWDAMKGHVEDLQRDLATLQSQADNVWADELGIKVEELRASFAAAIPQAESLDTALTDMATGGAVGAAASLHNLSVASKVAFEDLSKGFIGVSEAISSGGAEAGVEYAKELVAKLATLSPEAQAAIAPFLTYLQQVVETLQQYGGDAGFGFSYNAATGLQVNLDPIQTILGQYDSAFDRRQLYAQLGIQTGDNFGQNTRDRVEAWFGPIKAQLDLYLKAFEIVAGMGRSVASSLLASGAGILPGVGATIIALENSSSALESFVQGKRDELSSLKSDVDAVAAKAIKAHDDAAAAKAKKGPKASDSGQMDLNEQRKKNALDNAVATIQEMEAEIRLREERQNLEDATERLKDITEEYDDTLSQLQDNIDSFDAVFEEAIYGIEEQLYSLNNELKRMKQITENALEPFRDELDRTKDKLEDLRDATQAMDEWFDTLAHGYLDQQNQMEDAANDLHDRLRDLADEERAAMAGINAIIELDQSAVEQEQANIDAITDKYEKLIDLKQHELDLLLAKDNQVKRDEELQNMAQEVGNLQARIANAIPGSREYNALMKERDATVGALGRKQKEFKLEDQIAALKEAQKIATESAQASLKAAEQQLKNDQAIAKQMQAGFDQRREALALEQEILDKRKEQVDRELEAIARQKEAYDYEQHQKELAAQADEKRAQDEYDRQKERGEAAVDAIQAEIDKREEMKEYLEHEQDVADRRFEKQVEQIQFLKREAVAAQQAIVDGLAAIFKSDQDAQDAQEFANKYAKAINTLTTAILAYGAPIGHAADGTKIYAENTADVNKANKVLSDALNNDVTPAVQKYADKTLPAVQAAQAIWMKYFAPVDKGGDSEKSVEWYMSNRNSAGFYQKIITSADLALGVDGLRGMINNRIDDIGLDMNTKLAEIATDSGLAAESIGKSILDGITKALGNKESKSALAQALIDAVMEAIDAAESKIESGSPSELSGRLLGKPLIQGVGKGAKDNAADVARDFAETVRSVTGSVSGYVAGDYRTGSSARSGDLSGVSVETVNVTLSFPNITDGAKIPKTRDDYAKIGVAVNQGMAYDLARRGAKVIRD